MRANRASSVTPEWLWVHFNYVRANTAACGEKAELIAGLMPKVWPGFQTFDDAFGWELTSGNYALQRWD